jgi:chaperonin cofactor prefoldin
MKKLLLPLVAILCCVSGAMAQQAGADPATERKISALENAKNSAIKSANEQYQADVARIQKTSLSSIERINEDLENLKGSQTGTTTTRSGNSGAKSPIKKKTEELEKRIKTVQERQEKLLKGAHEEYLKKFNLYKKNHYAALKPLAPEKAEEFMKECTPLEPVAAAQPESKDTAKKK